MQFYCLDTESGSKLWKVKTNNALVSVPIIDNNKVYVGSSDGIFRCIKLETGELNWEFSGIRGYVESKPLVYQNNVYFTAWDGKLYSLDKNSGKLIWIRFEKNPSGGRVRVFDGAGGTELIELNNKHSHMIFLYTNGEWVLWSEQTAPNL